MRQLPSHTAHLVKADWVPWGLVYLRHQGDHEKPLTALFEAYRHLLSRLPVVELSNAPVPYGSDGCRMCGSCCSCMRPGAVSSRTFRAWKKEGYLIADFFHTACRGENPTYVCWFFSDQRLRICPLLLFNTASEKPFCSVHHLGPGQRHPACSTYRPNPPLCRATALSLDW